MTDIEKDFLDSCKFTIKELLSICEKNDDMTVREKKYLDKRLNDLSDYKGSKICAETHTIICIALQIRL